MRGARAGAGACSVTAATCLHVKVILRVQRAMYVAPPIEAPPIIPVPWGAVIRPKGTYLHTLRYMHPSTIVLGNYCSVHDIQVTSVPMPVRTRDVLKPNRPTCAARMHLVKICRDAVL